MILEMLGGALVRFAPEVLKFFDRKNERAHEALMFDKSIESDRVKGQMAIAIQESQANSAYDVGALQAYVESIKAQAMPTGVKWVDAMSALVRPAITFAYFGLYAGCRIASLAIMMGSGATAKDIVTAAWTAPDMEVLSGILSFWFMDRILTRARR